GRSAESWSARRDSWCPAGSGETIAALASSFPGQGPRPPIDSVRTTWPAGTGDPCEAAPPPRRQTTPGRRLLGLTFLPSTSGPCCLDRHYVVDRSVYSRGASPAGRAFSRKMDRCPRG